MVRGERSRRAASGRSSRSSGDARERGRVLRRAGAAVLLFTPAAAAAAATRDGGARGGRRHVPSARWRTGRILQAGAHGEKHGQGGLRLPRASLASCPRSNASATTLKLVHQAKLQAPADRASPPCYHPETRKRRSRRDRAEDRPSGLGTPSRRRRGRTRGRRRRRAYR